LIIRQSRKRNFKFEFRPNVVNNGKTPASNVRIVSLIDFKNPIIPPNFDFMIHLPPQSPAGSIATIGPGKEKFHSSILVRQLTWAELREHAKGVKWFHVWGQVTYEDIFKIERHTYFSFRILIPTRKSESVLWLATDRHNHYD
jgi:hypothetical protein